MIEKTFIINLEKHKDRKKDCLLNISNIDNNVLGEVIFYNAINGNKLNLSDLEKKNIKIRKEWKDFLNDRNLTKGELGCALSHYNIWKQIANENLNCAYIMEDDVNFNSNFNQKINLILKELENKDWDFCFLDRKHMYGEDSYVSDNLIKPSYSFWLNSYLINSKGAKKLVNTDFLKRIIPVDEYVPMMYYNFLNIKIDIKNRIYPEEFIKNYNHFNKFNKVNAFSSKDPLTYIRYEYDYSKSSTENSEEIVLIEKFNQKKKFNLLQILLFLFILIMIINKFSNFSKN